MSGMRSVANVQAHTGFNRSLIIAHRPNMPTEQQTPITT